TRKQVRFFAYMSMFGSNPLAPMPPKVTVTGFANGTSRLRLSRYVSIAQKCDARDTPRTANATQATRRRVVKNAMRETRVGQSNGQHRAIRPKRAAPITELPSTCRTEARTAAILAASGRSNSFHDAQLERQLGCGRDRERDATGQLLSRSRVNLVILSH